jgi:4-amino-4-deoxy-L-arabinose transferase
VIFLIALRRILNYGLLPCKGTIPGSNSVVNSIPSNVSVSQRKVSVNKTFAGIVVLTLFITTYILPLGIRPMIFPDESRYAEIPREMLASGDWVVPHLNGLRYFEKPALGYWLIAASTAVFGTNSFAVRIPLAASAGLSALAIYFLMRKDGDDHLSPVVAPGVFLTFLEVFGVGTFCVLDSILAFFLTGSMTAFFHAIHHNDPRKKNAFLVIAGLFCGLAFLTKGFLALVLPVIVIVPFLIWEGRKKEWIRLSLVPLLAAFLISLPWSLAIDLREPDFWKYFFWTEHIQRFMSSEAQHPEALWFFIPVIMAGTLPWTPMLPAAISGFRKFGPGSSIHRFAWCWLLFPFLFFSISRGKLLTYILPCFPPVAILLTSGLITYLKDGKRRLFTLGASITASICCLTAVVVIYWQVSDSIPFKVYDENEIHKWSIAVIGLLICAVLSLAAIFMKKMGAMIFVYCLAAIPVMWAAHSIVPNLIIDKKSPLGFLERCPEIIDSHTSLVSDSALVRDVCFHYGTDNVYLLNTGGELAYGLSYVDARDRLLDLQQISKMVMNPQRAGDVVLITTVKYFHQWKKSVPDPTFQVSNGYFIYTRFSSNFKSDAP